ncbi:nose resistant to fluoxetine protein 6-like [Belonocnema kinseyi]|uniref:nose resistant to fluoxetine protein 6-like n=1 Tax=Belonocnema kinseyi TaxID=2817044 RepID=UPI00143D2B62|nr:nose resistant to fluoxetine protein 6-like [Belonocnema kinseyi]
MSYLLLEYMEKWKRLNVLFLIIHRFVRLVPSYAFVIFAYAVLLDKFGTGPFWENRFGFDRDSCSSYWWENLLFISNYANGENRCMLQSWYLSVDFQCFIVGLFLVGIFWKLPRIIGYVFLGSFLIISTLIPFYVTYKYDIEPFVIALGNCRRIDDHPYFRNYYIKTHMHLPAYIVGIIMGAFIYDYKFATWRLPKMCSRILFILQVVVLSLYIQNLGFQFMDPNEKPSLFVKALYGSLHRPIFAFSICSAALLITIGDGLDFHYNLMTHRWIQPFSKLSYVVYLLHFAIQSYDLSTAREPFVFSLYNTVMYLVVDIIFVLILSLLFVVVIEEPFKNIGNLLFRRKEANKPQVKLS